MVARFFHEKERFVNDEVADISQIDYTKNLTIVATIGEIGFEQVVGIGEYLLDPAKNMAEIAFSISREFQHKGLGKTLLRKLAEAAHENGISGL